MASAEVIHGGRKHRFLIGGMGAIAACVAAFAVTTSTVDVDSPAGSALIWLALIGGLSCVGFSFFSTITLMGASKQSPLPNMPDILELPECSGSPLPPELPRSKRRAKKADPASVPVEEDQDLILDLKTSNRLLAREQGRLFKCLDTLRDGLILIHDNGRIQFANEAAAQFINVPVCHARGKILSECSTKDEIRELLESGCEHAGSGGAATIELEPDAEVGHDFVLATLTQQVDTDGIGTGKALVFQEIGRLKSMESLQSQFVDSVAHELRTPLTSIRGYAEMLIDGNATDKQTQHDFFNVIYEETYRLSQLIDNLLNMSMMESGAARLEAAPTRLKRFLEENADVIRQQCERKDITLNVELGDRLPTLNVDKSLFGMAIMNLLSNAVKYTPDGGTITLRTTSSEEGIRIVVEDTGVGIPEDELPRIFEKFYRASSSGEAHGSGVGLSTAIASIRLHGGDIEVKSELGAGSTFEIVLPRELINKNIGE